MAGSNEFPFESVPQAERRGPFVMGLLWITMVTAFPTVLAGFAFHQAGLTLGQVIPCSVISCLMLLAYAVPAALLGATSGQTYTGMSRIVFGKWGSRLVTVNLLWMFIAFYGLTALFMAEATQESLHIKGALTALTVVFAILMAFNNFFGFKGVANFARYIAAPVLIVWVFFTFIKATAACPPTVLQAAPHKTFAEALTVVSSFIIGFACWGNEADYWRFGKAKISNIMPPMIVALIIGQIIFPITGWMIAHMSGVTEYAAATSFMTTYSFGGMAILGCVFLGISYFAVNDSNLFGSTYACENIKQLPHRLCVSIIAIVGALVGAILALTGTAKSLETIACLNAVILPTPTVIMLCEWGLFHLVFKNTGKFAERIPGFNELPNVRAAATIALLTGIGFGLLTSGIIPGTEHLKVGIASVQTWLVCAIVYLPLRVIEHKKELRMQVDGLEHLFTQGFPELISTTQYIQATQNVASPQSIIASHSKHKRSARTVEAQTSTHEL